MKVLAIFLLLALAYSQAQTVTEDLLAAQRELTIGHEFAEVYVIQNRVLLSDYLARIEVFVLDHFMKAYAQIKITGLATREEMESFVEPSFCKDIVRARWELQMTRYGQRLSQCLGVTSEWVKQMEFLNFVLIVQLSYVVTYSDSLAVWTICIVEAATTPTWFRINHLMSCRPSTSSPDATISEPTSTMLSVTCSLLLVASSKNLEISFEEFLLNWIHFLNSTLNATGICQLVSDNSYYVVLKLRNFLPYSFRHWIKRWLGKNPNVL